MDAGSVALLVLAVVGGLLCGLLAHELGHAAGAAMTGMAITTFRIGTGRTLAHFKIRDTDVSVNLGRPASAVMVEARSARSLRRSIVTMAAAGPIIGAALFLPLMPWAGTAGRLIGGLVILLNLSNLIPARGNGVGGVIGSDGMVIALALRGDPEVQLRFTLLHQARLIGAAVAAGGSANPVIDAYRQDAPADDPTATVILLMRDWAPDQEAEKEAAAAAAMAVTRSCPPGSPVHVLLGSTLNSLIYARLEAGHRPNGEMVGELAAAVAAPVAIDKTALEDTLAWALASLGRPTDGLRHSNHVLATADIDDENRARCLAVNAICLAGLGKIDRAVTRRSEALELDPACPLLPHVDRALGDSASQQVPDRVYAQLEKLSELQPGDAELDAWLDSLEADQDRGLDGPAHSWREWFLHRVLPGLVIAVAFMLLLTVGALLF